MTGPRVGTSSPTGYASASHGEAEAHQPRAADTSPTGYVSASHGEAEAYPIRKGACSPEDAGGGG